MNPLDLLSKVNERLERSLPKRRKGESKFQQHIRGEQRAYNEHPEKFPGGRDQAIAIAAHTSGEAEKAWHDEMPGGNADDSNPGDFDLEVLAVAIREEMSEHTNSPHIAAEIAMDHLKEDPRYYDDLLNTGGNDE